ncbi:MAG: hypothetical protein MJ229_01400 [bacterium]|nr:hypothetical protein [bacterium]
MDEKKRILRVIEREAEEMKQEEKPVSKQTSGFAHPNQSNPIKKNMMNFVNSKIGDKFSVNDLLR